MGIFDNQNNFYKGCFEGRGPAGTAIRNNKFVVCNDIATAPSMKPWKEEALKRDYKSVITLPIRRSGYVIGVFTLYNRKFFLI
jgi:GAF domain-containing protein